jgi:MFS family permease
MDTGSSSITNGSPYEILRNRDFLLYLIGRLAATLGQQMFAMAIGWELYERTHSAFALGLVGLTQVVPMFLLTLPAGHVADNQNRKHVIVVTTVIIACTSAGLTLISAYQAPVAWTYLCLFVIGATRTFLWAATASFLPQLVERRNFSRAVTWNAGMFQISSIVGPTVAGLVIGYTHHAAPVYAINAIGAAICCVLMGMVHRHHVVAVKERMSFKALLTGFSFVFTNRIVLGIITLDMFAVLLGGATALMPVFAKDILFVGPRGLGLLQAALPLGAIVCGFILAHRPPMQKAGRALLLGVTAFGLATIGFGFSKWFWPSFLLMFACGASDNISVVVRHTLVQMLTPDEKRGRVSAVNNLFIGTSNELGEFESGTVAHWLGPVFAVVSGGVGTILVVIAVALFWPEIRKYGRLDGPDPHEVRP